MSTHLQHESILKLQIPLRFGGEMGDVDIYIKLLVNLWRFIEEHCIVRLGAIENGDALICQHFQMVLKDDFSSLSYLEQKDQGRIRMACKSTNISCYFL